MNMKKKNEIAVSSLKSSQKIVEMLYFPLKNETAFAVYTGDSVSIVKSVEMFGEKYQPLSPQSDIVRKKVVLFPSSVEEYENDEILLSEVQSFIHRFLDITEIFEKIAAYYVLFTWIYDKFNEVPYLRAIGDYGSGKTRFLQVIGGICYKPIFAGGATTVSPIFRVSFGVQSPRL